jgi:hypothetical protein
VTVGGPELDVNSVCTHFRQARDEHVSGRTCRSLVNLRILGVRLAR